MFQVSFSSLQGTISLSYSQSWRRKRSSPASLSAERKHTNLKKPENQGGSRGTDSWVNNMSVGADALDLASLDTQDNMERQCNTSGWRDRKGSMSSTLTA